MEKLKKFLKERFENGIQGFDNENWIGDYTITIYDEDEIIIKYAPEWEYIEILGIENYEFSELKREGIIY